MSTKENLRILGNKIRNNISNKDLILKSNFVKKNILNHEKFLESKKIFIYLNFGNEIITTELIKKSLSLNKKVAVPVIFPNYEMKFFFITNFNNLKINKYGILEPNLTNSFNQEAFLDKNSIIIIPGLIFDKNFFRVGYGGGYYDRFLEKQTEKQFSILGICFESQIVDSIITDKYDKPVDFIVTEEKILQRR